jgi:heme oxygenase
MAILTSLFLVSRSAEGRPMDKAEWELLLRLTADLHTEFDNVQMRFDDSPTSDSYSESMNQMNNSMNNNSSNWELERAKP